MAARVLREDLVAVQIRALRQLGTKFESWATDSGMIH